ncbi:MAG: hypothetical protein RIF32_04875 [Leptospirales bacterium]
MRATNDRAPRRARPEPVPILKAPFRPGLLAVLFVGLFAAPIAGLVAERNEIIYAFRNFKTEPPTRMILVGEIQSKTKVATVETIDSPFPGYDIREDQVNVKVQNRRGLKVGQKLYVIDKDPFHSQYRNGLIVGEIKVTSVLYHPFYGWVVTGTGILLRVREGQFVARTLDTENLERAYALKKRGDHYANRGNFEKAISSYNEALVADSALPEANAAMGELFFQIARDSGRELPVRALSEYDRAWRNRVNFRYDYEKFAYYKRYMETLYYTYRLRQLEATRSDGLVRLLDRIVTIAAEARKVQDHADVRMQLARAHYYRMIYYETERDPEERRLHDASDEAAGALLKDLVEARPPDAEVYRLALLYYGRRYEALAGRPNRTLEQDRDVNRLRSTLEKLAPMYRQYHGQTPDPEVFPYLEMVDREAALANPS